MRHDIMDADLERTRAHALRPFLGLAERGLFIGRGHYMQNLPCHRHHPDSHPQQWGSRYDAHAAGDGHLLNQGKPSSTGHTGGSSKCFGQDPPACVEPNTKSLNSGVIKVITSCGRATSST